MLQMIRLKRYEVAGQVYFH